MNNPEASREAHHGSVAAGFGLGICLTIAQGVLTLLVSGSASGEQGLGWLVIGLLALGLIQLVYVLPIFFYLRSRQKTQTAKGLLIETCLVLLINATCWTMMFIR